MLANLVPIFISLLGVNYVHSQTYTDCRQIPNTALTNHSQLVSAGPLHLIRSSDPSETCSTGVLTGPASVAGGGTLFNYLILQGNKLVYSIGIDPAGCQDTFSNALQCGSGGKQTFKFLPYDLTGSSPYFVNFLCDETTGAISDVRGFGNDEEAGCSIDALVSQYLSNIPGGQTPTTNMWANCPTTPYCGGFFN